MINKIVFLSCILLISFGINGQNLLAYKVKQTSYINQSNQNIFTDDYSYKKNIVIPAVTLSSLGAGAFFIDSKTADYFQSFESKNKFYRNFSSHYTELGSYYGLAGLGAFTLGAYFLKNEKAMQTGVYAGQSVLLALFASGIIKLSAGRERPFHYYSTESSNVIGGKWYGLSKWKNTLSLESPFDSFVSGHTALAFAMATTFSDEYKNLNWLPYAAFSAASLVAFTRITQNKHWLSDVVFGAMVGFLSSKASFLIRQKWLSFQIQKFEKSAIIEFQLPNEVYFS